jgi:hypothetical protein
MKPRYIKTWRIYLLCLASIVFAFNNAYGFVYCQSEDGQSSFEPITNTCCNVANINTSPEDTEDSLGKTFITNRDGCGPCVDTMISIDAVNPDKKTTSSVSIFSAVPGFVSIIDGCYGSSVCMPCSVFPASVNPSLPSMRTIVLLA